MDVSDIMAHPVQVIPASHPIGEVAARMVSLGYRHLPVVDASGALAGIALDAVVFRHGGLLEGTRSWLAREPGFDALTAGDIAEEVAVVVDAGADLARSLRRLAEARQDALIVAEGRHPIGIVTEQDIMALALDVIDESFTVEVEGSRPVACIDIGAPAATAAERMRAARIRHLGVTDGPRLCGVISMRDAIVRDLDRHPDLRVGDVMSAEVRTAIAGSSLREAALAMKENKIGCIPIVDASGRPVRIVTRRDVLEAVAAGLEAEDLFPTEP